MSKRESSFSQRTSAKGAEGARELSEGSWLVQRLTRPVRGGVFSGGNPFSFGGGYKNGGLTDEAMALLRDVFAFDYMGSAEFEFGAVPEALQRLASADLVASWFTVPLATVPANWRDKSKTKPKGEATVYVLCPAEVVDAVKKRVDGWTRTEHPRLKESLRLTSALRPVEDYDRDVCGWLELNNGFLFFTDREMWANACALFSVEVPAPRSGANRKDVDVR